MADPPPCYLLEKIPAELRNGIYDLVFAPDDEKNDAGEVNLCKAKFPPKNLIITCRQIHSEAAKMYKAKYQRYWRSSEFSTDGFEPIKYPGALDALKEEDVEQVTQLRIDKVFHAGKEYFLLPECRGWKFEGHGQDAFVLPYLIPPDIADILGDRWMMCNHYGTYEEMMEGASKGPLPGSIKDHVLWLTLGRYEGDAESDFSDESETDEEYVSDEQDEEDSSDEDEEEA